MQPSTLSLHCPAKLNLFLHVTGRRPDGYHTLETLMVPLAFGDRIQLSSRPDGMIVRGTALPGVSEAEDLSIRAARMLQRIGGTACGATIDIVKRIPMGGGMGGGSANAGTVLVGLNALWQLGLSESALCKIALGLGADVPFFIRASPQLARGIGEELQEVSIPQSHYLLLFPGAHIATPSIFNAPDLTRDRIPSKIAVFSDDYGTNDLQKIAVAQVSSLANAVSELTNLCPEASAVRMTGSGSVLFARFASEVHAQLAAQRVRNFLQHHQHRSAMTVLVTRDLPRSPWRWA